MVGSGTGRISLLRSKRSLHSTPKRCQVQGQLRVRAELTIFSSADVVVGDVVGISTLMAKPEQSIATRLNKALQIGEEVSSRPSQGVSATIKLYSGSIAQGPYKGRTVLLKSYPGARGPIRAQIDSLAANEVAMHCNCQPPSTENVSPYVSQLLGGFEIADGPNSGEQWLVFADENSVTLRQYLAAAATATVKSKTVGPPDPLERWMKDADKAAIQRRVVFMSEVLRQVALALGDLHAANQAHGNLTMDSVALNSINERRPEVVGARVRDLSMGLLVTADGIARLQRVGTAFEDMMPIGDVDKAAATVLQMSRIWQRCRAANATTPMQWRAFVLAEDIKALGHVCLSTMIIGLSPPATFSAPDQLKVLLESALKGDMAELRESLLRLDAASYGVQQLDQLQAWPLIARMVSDDWQQRPSLEECLDNRILSGVQGAF